MAQQQVCTFSQKPALEPALQQALTVEVISNAEEFGRSRKEWDELVADSEVEHPFMSHAWLTTWWECFGEGNQLQIFVVKAGNQWIAAAPMMIRKTAMYGIPIHRLEALYNPHTPRYEFPIRCRQDEAYEVLWRAFSSSKGSWDVVLMPQFLSTSPTLAFFEKFAAKKGWSTGRWVGPPSPFIILDCEYDDLLNRIKTKERYNLRRRYTKLAELGEVSMEVIESREGVAEAMADGFRIEAAAWKGQAGTAMVSDPRVQEFYLKFAQRAADLGWLKLTFLRVGAKRVAFHLTLDTGRKVFGMKMGYDPEYHSFAPGHTLLTLILKDACDDRRGEFDFLGTNDSWKLVWTKETRTHPWLFMFRNGLRGRILHQLKFTILPALRRQEKLMRYVEVILGRKERHAVS